MSRILRRPMFRGGPVDSRGSGITSGLDKPKRGLVDEPGGYAGEKSGMDFLKNALNRYVLGSKTQIGNTSPLSANVLPQKSSFEQMISNNQFGNQDPTKVEDVTIEDKIESYTPDNEVIRSILERQSTYLDDDGVERSATTGEEIVTPSKTIPQDGFLPTPGPEKGVLPETNLPGVEKVGDIKEVGGEKEESVEYTVEDYIKMLGGDKAKRRDLGDMFARPSASFLGKGDVREGLAEFMKSEAAAGPSRREKIEQAAATLDIKDKIASKRAAEQTKQTLAGIDYKIGATMKAQQAAASLEGKDWIDSLRHVKENLFKGTDKGLDNTSVIEETLRLKYKKNVDKVTVSSETEIPKLQVEEGFTIVVLPDGTKKIYEVINGEAKERKDLRV